MGKAKNSKGGGDSLPHKHLHSRISYLHQAAAYLTAASVSQGKGPPHEMTEGQVRADRRASNSQAQSRYLVGQIQGVSRKAQIRLGQEVKHSVCKKCDTLLIPGQTSLQAVRNESKGGNKPWADVFEIRCRKCQAVKHFPTRDKARKKKPVQSSSDSDMRVSPVNQQSQENGKF